MFESYEKKNNSNEEILFCNLLKISHDNGSLTHSVVQNKTLLDEFKQSIYKQFIYTHECYDIKSDDVFNDVSHPYQPEIYDYGTCLCSKQCIRFHFIIKNRITDKDCWVGSSCVDKFFEHLIEDISIDNRYMRALASGIPHSELVCKNCNEKLIDRRISPCNKGFCSNDCMNSIQYYIINFGKYKGLTIKDMLKKNEGYPIWYNNKLKTDSTFCRQQTQKHPDFVKIIRSIDSFN